MENPLLRYLFGGLFLAFVVGQAVNAIRAAKRGGPFEYREKHHVTMQVFRKGIGIPWFLAIMCYVVKPEWVDWAAFSLPIELRWFGLVIGVVGLLLIWWTELALKENFATTLHLREAHTLITSGPYRYVRHPMYSAIAVFGVGMLILAPANWLIALPGALGAVVLMIVRIRREEEVLLERFGDEYRTYMQRTGRFLPRLRS